MDALSAAEKILTRLTADLEADRASRPPITSPDEVVETDASITSEEAATEAKDATSEAESVTSDEPSRPRRSTSNRNGRRSFFLIRRTIANNLSRSRGSMRDDRRGQRDRLGCRAIIQS
jgi:hypothetical protein